MECLQHHTCGMLCLKLGSQVRMGLSQVATSGQHHTWRRRRRSWRWGLGRWAMTQQMRRQASLPTLPHRPSFQVRSHHRQHTVVSYLWSGLHPYALSNM